MKGLPITQLEWKCCLKIGGHSPPTYPSNLSMEIHTHRGLDYGSWGPFMSLCTLRCYKTSTLGQLVHRSHLCLVRMLHCKTCVMLTFCWWWCDSINDKTPVAMLSPHPSPTLVAVLQPCVMLWHITQLVLLLQLHWWYCDVLMVYINAVTINR